jgi:hypothetical protein
MLDAALGALGLIAATTLLYLALWFWDFAGVPGADPLRLFTRPEAAATVQGLGEVTVAVLGIAITVVAIIVELAANRYTPRITELFLRDRVNGLVLSFFALAAALVLAVSMSLYGPVYPRVMVLTTLGMMVLSLTIILPYFLYVFDFLTPESVVYRIQRRAEVGLRRVASSRLAVEPGKREVAAGIEQLGEIAINSVVKKEKAIAISALRALHEVGSASLAARDRMPAPWFQADELAMHDQDMVSFHPDIARRLTERRTWVEMKVFRQYQSVFAESLDHLQDVAHIVAMHTRALTIEALNRQDLPATRLGLQFMHTYVRLAINARDVRTAYNVFNEYRLLGEAVAGSPWHDLLEEMSERARYYGQLAFHRQIPFLLETVAYDLGSILEVAHARASPAHDRLLATFLELDREPDGDQNQEASLRGVRKAQVKLATWYLAHDDERHARQIFQDMRDERPERLASIRDELTAIVDPEYWEVSDRGVDFDWLPEDRRRTLPRFFAWFQE